MSVADKTKKAVDEGITKAREAKPCRMTEVQKQCQWGTDKPEKKTAKKKTSTKKK